jgi:hypothetical protein
MVMTIYFAIENEIQSVTGDTDSQEIIENLSDPLIKTLAHVKLFEIAENDAMIKVQLERLRFKEAWSNLLIQLSQKHHLTKELMRDLLKDLRHLEDG